MNWYKIAQNNYRGEHEAADRNSGAPMHDLTGFYPEDIYSFEGVRYYGQGDYRDFQSIAVIRAARNHPNAIVKIYRAIPNTKTTQEKILEMENHKRYMLKNGKTPPNPFNPKDWMNTHPEFKKEHSKYYNYCCEEIERLKQMPFEKENKLSINPGDWVTINRDYAKEHGESTLNGRYKIISKMVRAKDLYTFGDSIHEWGYDP